MLSRRFSAKSRKNPERPATSFILSMEVISHAKEENKTDYKKKKENSNQKTRINTKKDLISVLARPLYLGTHFSFRSFCPIYRGLKDQGMVRGKNRNLPPAVRLHCFFRSWTWLLAPLSFRFRHGAEKSQLGSILVCLSFFSFV